MGFLPWSFFRALLIWARFNITSIILGHLWNTRRWVEPAPKESFKYGTLRSTCNRYTRKKTDPNVKKSKGICHSNKLPFTGDRQLEWQSQLSRNVGGFRYHSRLFQVPFYFENVPDHESHFHQQSGLWLYWNGSIEIWYKWVNLYFESHHPWESFKVSSQLTTLIELFANSDNQIIILLWLCNALFHYLIYFLSARININFVLYST